MKIRVLGAHNLESRHTRHTCLLVDETLALDAGSLASSLSMMEQGRLQAVLLTHRHLDHTRDLPTLGLATLNDGQTIDVYSLPETLEAVHHHLLNWAMYPDLTTKITADPPKFRFHPIRAWQSFEAGGCLVKPIPMPHPAPCVGFIVRGADGGCFAYTGDTGGELLPYFEDGLKPQILFVETTFPSRLEDLAELTGHLTPARLRAQLRLAQKRGAALPPLVIMHRSPEHEAELAAELREVAQELGVALTLGRGDLILEATPPAD